MAVFESTVAISSTSTAAAAYTILEPAKVQKATGYAITSQSLGAASVVKATGYQLLANPPAILKAQGYQMLWPGAAGTVHAAKGYVVWSYTFPPVNEFSVDYDFVEERFPDCISFGSSGGPGFMTNVVEFDSGVVAVSPEWTAVRASYSVTFETATPDEISLVEDFFYIAKGRAIGFRFKDWNDYQIVDQNVGLGDGITNAFQVFKRYQSGGTVYDRTITKLLRVSSNGDPMQITVDSVLQTIDTDVYVNESLGILSFEVPPPAGAIVKIVYGEYDVPVRFDTDSLDVSFDEFRQLSLEVPLIEVKI